MSHLKGGLITALITPFKEDGSIDYDSLSKLVEDQVEKGVEGFVISGTTGESYNLSMEELRNLYLFIKKRVSESFQMILGVGTNSTHKTIDRLKNCEDLNADAYLLVSPYYNKPSQQGLYEHFSAIAGQTEKNIILYDVPGRSIVEISVETTLKLSKIPNVIGIKDATGNLEKLSRLKSSVSRDFLLLSGDDETSVEFVKQGGAGVISVLSHLTPEAMLGAFKGELDYGPYKDLAQKIFMEPSPAPVKSALKIMGLIKTDRVRLPLVPTTEGLNDSLLKSLKDLGLCP